jgi:hypothetical protein
MRCLIFEGIPVNNWSVSHVLDNQKNKWNFTKKEWAEAKRVSQVKLAAPFTREIRSLMISRMLRQPLALMAYKIGRLQKTKKYDK